MAPDWLSFIRNLGLANVNLGFCRHLLPSSPQTHSSGICTYSALMEERKRWPPNTQNALKLSLTYSSECIRWDSGSKYSTNARSPVPSHCISSAELGVWSVVGWLKAETVWSPSCSLMLFFLSLAISTVTELFYSVAMLNCSTAAQDQRVTKGAQCANLPHVPLTRLWLILIVLTVVINSLSKIFYSLQHVWELCSGLASHDSEPGKMRLMEYSQGCGTVLQKYFTQERKGLSLFQLSLSLVYLRALKDVLLVFKNLNMAT